MKSLFIPTNIKAPCGLPIHSARFVYYTYAANKNGLLTKKDSTEVNGFPAEALNMRQSVDHEGPHSIKNISTDTLIAYCVEYKTNLK